MLYAVLQTPRRDRLVGRADRQRRRRTRGPRLRPRRKGLVEAWRPEAVAAACDGDRFRPARLSVAEARLVSGLNGYSCREAEMPRAVANDAPEWLEPYLERAFG